MFVFVVLGGVTGLPSNCRVASARLSTPLSRCVYRTSNEERSGGTRMFPVIVAFTARGIPCSFCFTTALHMGAAALDIILNPYCPFSTGGQLCVPSLVSPVDTFAVMALTTRFRSGCPSSIVLSNNDSHCILWFALVMSRTRTGCAIPSVVLEATWRRKCWRNDRMMVPSQTCGRQALFSSSCWLETPRSKLRSPPTGGSGPFQVDATIDSGLLI